MKLAIRTSGVDPKRQVEWAEKIKPREEVNRDLDAVGCIFDCDDFGIRYDQAHTDAERAGFEVAASNPCFELWFVLHYREVHQAISTTDYHDLLQSLLKKNHSKTDATLFSELEPRRSKAMERAAKLHEQPRQSGESAAARNASTTVHRLLESLQDNDLH